MCSTHTQTHRDTSKIQYLPLFLFLFCFFRFPFPTSWYCPLSFSSSPRDNYTSLPVTVHVFSPTCIYPRILLPDYLSLFIDLPSLSLIRFSLSLFLYVHLYIALSPSQSQCITALASNTNSTVRFRRSTTTIQPFNCRYIYMRTRTQLQSTIVYTFCFLCEAIFSSVPKPLYYVYVFGNYSTLATPRKCLYLLAANHARLSSVRNILI